MLHMFTGMSLEDVRKFEKRLQEETNYKVNSQKKNAGEQMCVLHGNSCTVKDMITKVFQEYVLLKINKIPVTKSKAVPTTN